MRSGFARETGEPPRAGTVAERSAAAFTKSRRADARNDRPRGRSPSRKTGRINSLGVLLPSGQPREPPLSFGVGVLEVAGFMPRTLVLALATLVLAACTTLGGSPAPASSVRPGACPVTRAFQRPPDEVIDWARAAGNSGRTRDQEREATKSTNWAGRDGIWVVLPGDGFVTWGRSGLKRGPRRRQAAAPGPACSGASQEARGR